MLLHHVHSVGAASAPGPFRRETSERLGKYRGPGESSFLQKIWFGRAARKAGVGSLWRGTPGSLQRAGAIARRFVGVVSPVCG
jgi:hypothetical protein